ncbi:hypothetical protein U1Q18_022193 [Sarracenia purpurea var. burkii]
MGLQNRFSLRKLRTEGGEDFNEGVATVRGEEGGSGGNRGPSPAILVDRRNVDGDCSRKSQSITAEIVSTEKTRNHAVIRCGARIILASSWRLNWKGRRVGAN